MIGIILAGGYSKRFGEDKALYYDKIYHKSWIQIAVSKMQKITSTYYIVAHPQNRNEILENCPFLSKDCVQVDHKPYIGCGPLSALFSISQLHPNLTDYLIMPIDYPDLELSVLEELSSQKQVYLLDSGGNRHYTLAHVAFSKRMIQSSLDNHDFRLGHFLKSCHVVPLQIRTSYLQNINRKEGL